MTRIFRCGLALLLACSGDLTESGAATTLALKHPTRFAAIVAVCGGILPPSHFPQLDAGLREKDP